MEWEPFSALVERCVENNESLMAFVRCRIFYSGRAEAELDWGDRMLIIKQDNAVLIHQPENGNPINYLKPGARISIYREEGALWLEGSHPQTNDIVQMEIQEIHDAMRMKLEDGKKQVLAGTEADMSDWIRDNPSSISPDFKPLSREEHTNYGFIDVFGHNGNGELVIVECKRYTAGLAAATQLRRYVEKMKGLRGTDQVGGVLASPKITTNAEQMLNDWGFKWVRVVPPKRITVARDQKSLEEW